MVNLLFTSLVRGFLGGFPFLPRDVISNTHRRRDSTVELRRVGVGGVYMNLQLAHDDCRRIRYLETDC